MIVTFRTKAHGNVTMFGDVAVALLKLGGLSGNVPTAILAADVSGVMERLRAAVEEHGHTAPQPAAAGSAERRDDETAEPLVPLVPLGHRARPLLELLRAASAAGADVLVQPSA